MKSRYFPILIVLLVLGLLWVFLLANVASKANKGNAPEKKTLAEMAWESVSPPENEKIIFASGCAKGDMRESFGGIGGVIKAEAGYATGAQTIPAQSDVCSRKSTYIRAVRVLFDPEKADYKSLCRNFWALHNPADIQKQDKTGKQCPLSVYYTVPAQEAAAAASLQDVIKSGKYSKELKVGIVPVGKFYTSKEYDKICAKKKPAAPARPRAKKGTGRKSPGIF